MKWRILLLSLGITVVCILVFTFAATQVYYNSTIDDGKKYLRVYMNVYEDGGYSYDADGARSLSERLNGARVTFMDGRGNVIADSDTDNSLTNHSDRKEVQDAILGGEGFAVRGSSTLGKNMIYFCKSYGSETLVRIAVNVYSDWNIFVRTLPTAAQYFAVDLALCVLLAFVATHFILNPVKNLAADAVSGGVVMGKYSELEPIARILNERNRNIKLQLSQINAEKELAEQARKSKDEFISNITHEMNTPLTSIRGYAELLGSGKMTEAQKAEAYKTILSQSERLTNLIACIINYGEIDSDELPPYEVDFTALAREAIKALKPEADKKQVTVIENIDDGVIISSRHERVSEVFGNLLRNAVRYNKKGGTVTVTLTQGRLIVEDTGIGIAEENMGKVFSRFFTVDKSHGGKNGGFGLGLAVVKKICKKSGWTIDVESKLGEGSKFTVEF